MMKTSRGYRPARRMAEDDVRDWDEILRELQAELERLDAQDVQLALDDQFEPEAGALLRVEIGLAFWHLPPEEFQSLTRDLSAGAGSEAVKEVIEARAMHVWHGPSPRLSRDTSP